MSDEKRDEKLAVTIEGVTMTEEAGAVVSFVTLQDAAQRQMRICIGTSEALALSLGMQGHAPDRPHTYDAMLACIAATGSVVEEVCISSIQAETYYAMAALRVGHHRREVDMRPSDALNLVVRTRCPVFVSEAVFDASLAPPADVSDELARLFTENQADRSTDDIN